MAVALAEPRRTDRRCGPGASHPHAAAGSTAIYSRSDGVVAWQACRDVSLQGVENVEVESSHLGLVWHPEVLDIVADRLRSRPRHNTAGKRRPRGVRIRSREAVSG
jgi:hypothetical protein